MSTTVERPAGCRDAKMSDALTREVKRSQLLSADHENNARLRKRILRLAYSAGAQPRLSMSEHTYRMIELVGSSHASIEAAVDNAVAKAAHDEKNLRWLEVKEIRGHIEDGTVAHWQVRVKIGSTQKT